MPTRPKKGGGPKEHTSGSAKRGGQKAVVGSARTPEVAAEAKKGLENDEEQASPEKE